MVSRIETYTDGTEREEKDFPFTYVRVCLVLFGRRVVPFVPFVRGCRVERVAVLFSRLCLWKIWTSSLRVCVGLVSGARLGTLVLSAVKPDRHACTKKERETAGRQGGR